MSEFTTLYQVHLVTTPNPIDTVTSGSHHSYALIPVALLAAIFGVGVQRTGSRPALLAIGLLGVVALIVALAVDLPDAQATGIATRQYVLAKDTASAGLYMETLGAILLIATCGLGFFLLGPPSAPGRPARRPPAAV